MVEKRNRTNVAIVFAIILAIGIFILNQFEIITFGLNPFIFLFLLVIAAALILNFLRLARDSVSLKFEDFVLLAVVTAAVIFGFTFVLPNSPLSVEIAGPILSTIGVGP